MTNIITEEKVVLTMRTRIEPPDTFGSKPRRPRVSQDDPWIRRHAWAVSIQKVHAVGVLVLTWSGVEHCLIEMSGVACGLDPKLAWALFHDQGDVRLIEKVKAAVSLRPPPPIIVERATQYMKYYDRCRVNRNLIVHSTRMVGRGGTTLRRPTKKYREHTPIKSSVGHIRRAADYMGELGNAIMYLTLAWKGSQEGRSLDELRDLMAFAVALDPPEELSVKESTRKAASRSTSTGP